MWRITRVEEGPYCVRGRLMRTHLLLTLVPEELKPGSVLDAALFPRSTIANNLGAVLPTLDVMTPERGRSDLATTEVKLLLLCVRAHCLPVRCVALTLSMRDLEPVPVLDVLVVFGLP